MEDIIDIIVTETTNTIEITSQPTDEIIDVNIIDNREDVTLNVTPTLVEININSLTGNFGILWGEIEGTLSNQTDLNTALGLKADLVGGKVPSSQLPSYVDDVVEVANYASLPATGETGKIYITIDTNYIYRWTGSVYVEIKDSSAVWGAITGTLSNQTDLQNALNAKLSTSTAASTYVPYTGATGNVNLGLDYSITAALIIKSGGTSTQFLKADGSIDTNTYATTSQLHNAVTIGTANGLSLSTQVLSLGLASSSANGALSSTDWTTFNGKQNALSGTGFVKISGTTISYDNSTYALDSAVVKLTGNQTIAGTKKFTDSPLIDIDLGFKTASGVYTYLGAFDAGWSLGMTSGINHLFYFGSTTARSYTFPNADGTVALTSNLSSYLPLAGGTLTGELNATGIKISGNSIPYIMSTLAGADLNIQFPVGQKLSINDNGATNVAYFSKIEHRLLINGSIALTVNSGGTSLNSALVGTTANFSGALSGTSATFNGLVSAGNSSPSTSYNAGSWFTGDGLVVGTISSVNGIQINSSTTSTLSAIRFGDGDGANNLYDQGFIIYRHSTDAMLFGTNRSTALTIASTGAATFSSSVTASGAKSQFVAEGGASSGAGISLNTSLSGTDRRNWFIGTEENVAGDFVIKSSNAAGGNAQSGTTRLQINNTGNVAIGTTAASAQGLTIYQGGGDRRIMLELNRPNSPGLQSAIQFTVGGSIMVGQIQHEYVADNYNHMSFSLRNPGGATIVPLWLNNNGNVGINTSSPQDRLDVNGSIRFRLNTPDFTAVANSGVIDYVSTSLFPTDPCIRIAAIGSSTVPASIRFQVGSTTTGPIERLRLTPSGVLGFNGDSLEASGGFDKFSLGFSVGNYAWIQSWGGNVIYINKQGNAVYAGTQRIDNNSDARIKTNIQNIENALETVLSLSGKKFNMLDENNILRYGFIAQEVQPHLNDFVTQSDRKFEKDNLKIENLLTLESSGSAWGALLVEAIKEQQSQIEELKQLINK